MTITPEEKIELEERVQATKSNNISAVSILAILEEVEWLWIGEHCYCQICCRRKEADHAPDCELRFTILKLKETTPSPEPGGYLGTLEREKDETKI